MKAIRAADMQALDRETIAAGTPGHVLMERAGAGAVDELLAFAGRLPAPHRRQFLIVNGKGNNGGDGYVMARLLAAAGHRVRVFSLYAPAALSGDAALNARRLPTAVPLQTGTSIPGHWLAPGTIVVDCILGTGITGAVREPSASIIAELNASGLPLVAIDLPSGLDADTGAVANTAIIADMTITMATPKAGLLCGAGPAHRGTLRCVDIGVAPAALAAKQAMAEAVTAADIMPLLGRLDKHAHKGTMGRVLVIGGSRDYPGAPMLAGAGALRSGAGLVTAAAPAGAVPLLRPTLSALILHAVADADRGVLGDTSRERLAALAAGQDAVVLGPGLTRGPQVLALVAQLLDAIEAPVILDADGLSVFTLYPDALARRTGTVVLTPHPGEMARCCEALGLTELLSAPRQEQAAGLAVRTGAVVVLKGADTVVAGPAGETTINTSGTAALATGGTGDVLAGMVAAWVCQCDDPATAARAAVYLHGYAAELARTGMRHLVADDLPDLIGQAMAELSPTA
jgi:NAD(P)H-hydrate epimerase